MASGTGNSGNGDGSGDGPAWPASHGPASEPVNLARQGSIRVGPLTVDPPARRIAHDDGREEILEPRMMQVLVALIRARGGVVSRDDLIDSCWDGRIVGDDAISSVIYRLRRAVKDIADDVFAIETVAKVGFRLVVDPLAAKVEGAAPPAGKRTGVTWGVAAAWTAGLAAVAAIGWAAMTGWSDRRAAEPAAAVAEIGPAIAVLPFADLSAARDNAYFSEGMAEEIMGLLSNEPGVRVIGRTSIAMLGQGAGIDEARARLGVTHVLEGSVRKSGQTLRVNVRLIDARDGRPIWADRFDRSLGDVFAIQDEIGGQVLAQLRGTLAGGTRPARTFKTSAEVYDLYLAAIALERDETRSSSLRAKRLLERAIELDPNYAPAYARLASYGREVWMPGGPRRGVGGRVSGPGPVPAVALGHARRALALAPNLGDAHAAMGMLVENDWDWPKAIPHLQRAVEIDPGNFLAWDMLGHVQQMHQCRYDDAEASFGRASAIEPLVAGPRYSLTLMLAEMGELSKAEASVRRFTAVSRDPTHLPKFRRMLDFYGGNLSAAAALGRVAIRLDPENGSTRIGQVQILRALGLTDGAVQNLPDFERPVAAPLLKGDRTAAAAAAVEGGERIWRSGLAYRSLAIAALLGAGRHDWLLQSFDQAYSSVEAFDEELGCRHAVVVSPNIVLALRKGGRTEEAARLLRLAKARFQAWGEAGHRGPMHHVLRARLLVLAGRRDAALAALERAVALGWLDQFWPFFSLDDPLFDPIRSDPRFRAVEQRVQAGVRRERAELARSPSA